MAAEVVWLETLDLAQLGVQFRNRTTRIAPARIARPVLLRVLADRVQADADAEGDLRPGTRRLLSRLAAGMAVSGAGGESAAAPMGRPALQRGTVLVREWRGCLERVSVGQGGYAWAGSSYASLSAVATAITGTKWNGRRIFGLDRPAGKAGSRP